MIAVLASPIYIAINVMFIYFFMKWTSMIHPVFKKKRVRVLINVLWVFCMVAPVIGFLLKPSVFKHVFMHIGNYWFGVQIQKVLVVLPMGIIWFILRKTKAAHKIAFSRKFNIWYGAVGLLAIVGLSAYGRINAAIYRITPYEVKIEKDGGNLDELNVVLLGDLHIGYNVGTRELTRMVEMVNEQNADLIVIAGDFFDNNYDAILDPEKCIEILSGMKAKYGVYACYGNHDIDEKVLAGFSFKKQDGKKVSDPRMDDFIERTGIHLMRDEGILIEDSVYLFGRPDYHCPGRDIDVRLTPAEITEDMDLSKPVIVIDHEPNQLQELADAGVDLDLCGHTHDGQTFPGNIIIKFFWENACGLLQKDNMTNIVTSGIGVYGPYMRVGTKPEICPIKVTFA